MEATKSKKGTDTVNPQAENGHIDIANELGEAFYNLQLSGNQWRLLWVILRKTYGWHKKEDKISITQFQKTTKLKRRHICRSLKDMTDRHIITKNSTNFIVVYGLQKDYIKWELSPKKTLSETITKNDTPLSPKIAPPITKNSTKTITKNGDHKRNSKETIIKETNTKENIDFLIGYLNKVTGKNFKITTKEYRGILNARLKIYSVDELQKVIDIKFKDPFFIEKDLMNIKTLFGSDGKVETYLNWKPKLIKKPIDDREVSADDSIPPHLREKPEDIKPENIKIKEF